MSEDVMDAVATRVAASGQYLTFTIGGCHYGIEILRVQEIRGQSQITSIPGSPPHVLGVLNLRGSVVPVIDLRVKFGVPSEASSALDVIIMVTLGDRVVGMVVDAVSDVLVLDDTQMVPPPDLGQGVDTSLLRAMAKTEDKLIALLDIERTLGMPPGESSLSF